jgi:N-acetylmuramoyl-L-alanine amidase
MINPVEFEWITNPVEQNKLATEISEAISLWFAQVESAF